MQNNGTTDCIYTVYVMQNERQLLLLSSLLLWHLYELNNTYNLSGIKIKCVQVTIIWMMLQNE